MQVKYLGHSCFQFTIGDQRIVLDPFVRGNALAVEAGIDIDKVEANYILVTHGHDDHTGDLVYLAKKTGALVVASWEICSWLGKQGYNNSHPMNIGGSKSFPFGSVKMTYASHSSSFPDGTYAGTPAGFLVTTTEQKTIYFAGDTALTQEMKLLGEHYTIDCSFLPIGDNFTMGVSDACIAASFVGCTRIIGMHYDTFGFIKIDQPNAKRQFEEAGKILQLLKIGEKTVI